MMAQELIHPVELSTVSRSTAPSIPVPSTAVRMDSDWVRVLVRTNQGRQPVQSTWLRDRPRRQCAPQGRALHRWGIVLAGGDGVRLRELTQCIWGDDRPKQFCPLIGHRTLLEETRYRAERSVPPEQILYSVTSAHRDYYFPTLADCPSQRVVQPSNKGTAPAILSAMMRIALADNYAMVVVLPSDHYFSPESVFTASLGSAFEIAQQRPHSVVLLGAEPKSPEVDYGWIELGDTIGGHSGLFHVTGFREKPTLPLAETLFKAGSLWNTFVMVGQVCAFLEMARATVPSVLQELEAWELMMSRGEVRIPDTVYNRIAPTDFSRQVISQAADRLLTLRLDNVDWSDLGDPYRVLATHLEKNGDLPSWAKLWSLANTSSRASAATA